MFQNFITINSINILEAIKTKIPSVKMSPKQFKTSLFRNNNFVSK